MGNGAELGSAFEVHPGGAKSSIFEHNSASSDVSPSSRQTFKDLVTKGHSKFNVEFFS